MHQPAPAPQSVDELTRAMTATADQSRRILDASVHTCAAELAAFLADLAKDNVEAVRGVRECRTPLDLLAVQQTWLAGRTEACLNAGARIVLGLMHEPEAVAAEAASFRLPD